MTTSTCGMSNPLAATSVASRILGAEGLATDVEKALRVFVRVDGVRFP